MNEKQKLFTRHSIGTRIAALFMLLILVITGVMTYVSISVSTNELLDSSTDYTEQLILRVNAELDMYVEYMKDISDFIVDNGAVAAYLRAANEHRLTDAADQLLGVLRRAVQQLVRRDTDRHIGHGCRNDEDQQHEQRRDPRADGVPGKKSCFGHVPLSASLYCRGVMPVLRRKVSEK